MRGGNSYGKRRCRFKNRSEPDNIYAWKSVRGTTW